MADRAAVLGLGMVTPLGHGAEASAAAIRAGLARFAELPWSAAVYGSPVVGAVVVGVTDGLLGADRMARLAAGAVADLAENAALSARDLAGAGFYVALPSPDRPGVDPSVASSIGRRIGEACSIGGVEARTRVFPAGHAATHAALVEALVDLRSRRVPRAIVGGVDTLVEPDTVAHYHAIGRLKSGDRPVGVMPGEAAAFFALELLGPAEARGATILAVLEAPATAVEPITIDGSGVCDGSGLAAAVARTLAALSDGGARTGLLAGDLNGEPYRSEEFAYMVARALGGVETPCRLWHAADCIGDTGAASGAVAIALAARGLARGYARTADALVFASSEGGLRGSVFLRRHSSNYGGQVARGRLQPAPGALADSPARPSPEGARENTKG